MTDGIEAPLWGSGWNEESLALAYLASTGVRDVQAAWADALDAIIMGAFGVSSVILAVVPTLRTPETTAARLLWVGAVVFWLVSCWFCYKGFKPAPFRIGPDPNVLMGEDWLARSPRDFQLWRMVYMGKSYLDNAAIISAKGKALTVAVAFAALEVLALTASLFVVRPC
jgi:hypothetical protein